MLPNNIEKELKKLNLKMERSELEDYAQECNAYMKIKYFMAKRIVELEKEINILQNELSYQVNMNEHILEWFKTIDITLKDLRNFNFFSLQKKVDIKKKVTINKIQNNSKINISEENAESLFIDENENSKNDEQNVKGSNFDFSRNESPIKLKFNPINDNIGKFSFKELCDSSPEKLWESDINPFDKDEVINEFKTHNMKLTIENSKLKQELHEKNLKINKLTTAKLIITNELNELLYALNRVDLGLLNKFYKTNCNKNFIRNVELPSSLGIKYNILSAQTQLGLIIEGRNNMNIEEVQDEKKTLNHQSYIKYKNIFPNSEEYFQKLINKNLRKKKILDGSDTD